MLNAPLGINGLRKHEHFGTSVLHCRGGNVCCTKIESKKIYGMEQYYDLILKKIYGIEKCDGFISKKIYVIEKYDDFI